jgi:hypothetical protein
MKDLNIDLQKVLISSIVAVTSNVGLKSLLVNNGEEMDEESIDFINNMMKENEDSIKEALDFIGDELENFYEDNKSIWWYIQSLKEEE